MKRYCALLLAWLLSPSVLACPVCGEKQPKVLKGITHGTGPDSQWDYVIIVSIMLIVLLTLFYSVKWLVWPGEKSEYHIKRLILPLDSDGR